MIILDALYNAPDKETAEHQIVQLLDRSHLLPEDYKPRMRVAEVVEDTAKVIEIDTASLIAEEDTYVSVTKAGYIKRTSHVPSQLLLWKKLASVMMTFDLCTIC